MQSTIKFGIQRHGATNIPARPGDASPSLTISRISEGTEIRSAGQLVGHVTDGTLYGLDRQGYAVEIGAPDDDREAVRMLKEWWNNVR